MKCLIIVVFEQNCFSIKKMYILMLKNKTKKAKNNVILGVEIHF